MQMQLGANISKKVTEARDESERARLAQAKIKRIEEEQAKAYAENKAVFEESFMLGATSVIRQLGKFYFYGDVEHNGEENIFHNARTIMRAMVGSGKSYGHMSYDDPPVYDEKPNWYNWNEERRKYSNNLFMFDEDEQAVPADDGLESYFKEEKKKDVVCAPGGRTDWQPDKKF